MRRTILALIIIALPCAAQAFDMQVQLAGWKYGTQLLNGYPVRTQSRQIPHFEQRLAEINSEINAIPYNDDAEEYREENHWATPIQFLQVGGQCRDYSVAKYSALYALGVADTDMQFVGVRVLASRYKGQFHAILVVRHAGRTYILDNLHSDVRPASAMAEYQPVYFINRQSWRTAQ